VSINQHVNNNKWLRPFEINLFPVSFTQVSLPLFIKAETISHRRTKHDKE